MEIPRRVALRNSSCAALLLPLKMQMGVTQSVYLVESGQSVSGEGLSVDMHTWGGGQRLDDINTKCITYLKQVRYVLKRDRIIYYWGWIHALPFTFTLKLAPIYDCCFSSRIQELKVACLGGMNVPFFLGGGDRG